MLKRGLLAGAAALLLILASGAPASALPGLTVGFSGGADPYMASGKLSVDSPWIARAQTEGAQMIRLDVTWSQIAPATRPKGFIASDPSSPGYDWTQLDEQVRELSGGGFKI